MWLDVVGVVVDLRRDGWLVEHWEVPFEEIDECEVRFRRNFFYRFEYEGCDLVADAGLTAGADYHADGEGGHSFVAGVEMKMENHWDVSCGLICVCVL